MLAHDLRGTTGDPLSAGESCLGSPESVEGKLAESLLKCRGLGLEFDKRQCQQFFARRQIWTTPSGGSGKVIGLRS